MADMVKLIKILVWIVMKLAQHVTTEMPTTVHHALEIYTMKLMFVFLHALQENGVMTTKTNAMIVTVNVKHVTVLKMTNV